MIIIVEILYGYYHSEENTETEDRITDNIQENIR